MANEKIYVGKDGAQELYRHIKGLIPEVDRELDENSNNAISNRAVTLALRNFGGFEPADPTGEDNHPDVDNPSTKVIYLVELPDSPDPDHYMEWIWSQPEGEEGEWKCIGDVSKLTVDSWKQWSAEHGSTAEADNENAVFIGPNNTIDRDDTYVLGDNNTVTTTDETDYTDTDVVAIGTDNTATNAANTYQLGRENSVSGNNLAYKDKYPHSMALNLGRNNTITGEGINVGKDNKTERFGVTVGQGNTAHAGSYAMGNKMVSRNGSIALGNNDQTGNTTSVSVPTMIINGKKYPVCKFQKVEPTVVGRVCATKTENTYSWIELKTTVPQYNYYRWYKNEDLNKSILAFGGYSGSTVQGYFDGNEQFVPSTDAGSKIYLHLLKVGNVSGPSVTVDFYASTNSSGAPIQLYSGYEIPKDSPLDNYPAVGTIYTESQLNEFIANTVAPISVKNDVVFDESDPSVIYTNFYTNRIYYSKYRIYGYYDGSTFIPYSKLTAYQSENWVWEVKDADEIGLRRESYRYNDIFGDDFEVAADSNSIAIGANQNVSTNSIGIAGNEKRLMYTYQNGDSSTSLSNTYYYRNVLSSDGSVSSTRFEARRMVCNNDATVTDYTGTFNKFPITVEGGSLSLSTGGDDYVVDPNLATYVTGRSISIGSVNKSKSGSIAIGSKNYAEGGSHIIGTSGNVTGGSFGYGNSLALEAGSYSVGSSNTGKFGSYAIGTGLSVSSGSFAFGSSSVVTNGSMSLGFHNKPDNVGYSIGQYNKAYWRSITLAANEREVYPPLEITNRKVFIYTNPDSVEVPVQGKLRPANGGTIEHVLAYFNVTADGKTIPVVEIGKIEATVTTYGIPQYYDESTHSFKYISSENLDVSTYTLNNIYKYTYTSGGTVYCEYSQNYGSSQSITNMMTANPMCTSSVMHGLLADKPSWFEIEVQAYTTGNDTYVYSYTKSYSYSFTTTYINLSKCTYKYAAINQTNINYNNWNTRLTPGGFNSSIAIGTRSHANGSSLAIGSAQPYATNNGYINGDLVFSLDSEMSPNRIGYPTKLYYIPIIEATGGSNATTTADSNSIAVGDGAVAENTSISFGRDTRAYFNAIAYGVSTYAQQNSIALGITSLARENSYSSGMFSTSAGNSIAIGWGADASNASTVFGKLSSAWSDGHVFGVNSIAYENGFVYGRQSKASRTAVVAGINSRASQYSSAFGVNNMALAGSTSVGSDNQATGGSIAAGVNNKAINTSGVLGNRNIAYGQSFALGFNNTVNGWSLAVGVNNISADAAGAHATLIGYNNTSTSTKENHVFVSSDTVGTNPNMAPLIGNIATSSILMGNLNKSEHYNSILIGIGNYSHTASSTQYPSDCRDDDGFVLAIGRENEVGRNYDIAIGYKSIANGGENVAVQHSYASGYRNIAMVDSTLKDCTANIALIESKLTLNNVYESIKNVIHNTLIHSDFTIANGNTSNNFILHTTGGMGTQDIGIHRNIIMVGSEQHPLNVSAVAATNNIIYGFKTGYTIARSFQDKSGNVSVSSNGKIDRNILLNNAYGSFVSGLHITDNIISASELEITASKDFQDNVILSSLAYMTYPTICVKNVILGKSRLDIRADAANVNNNFLMYSFLGDSNNGSAIVTGEYTRNNASNYMAQNFLFGTNAYHVGASVSFANPDRTTSPENAYYDSTAHYQNQRTAMLIDCVHVFNFGDNLLKGVDESYVFGAGQNVHSADNVVIYGNNNELSYTSGSIVMGARNNVLGMQKERPGQVTHNVIIGSENNIKAGYATDCNMIFGNNNNIQGHYTVVQKTTAEVANLPADTPEYFKTSADCLYPEHAHYVYIYSGNYYYFYSNGSLFEQYGAPATGSIVDTTTSNLLSNFNSHSLTEGKWYHPTSGSEVNAGKVNGSWIYANTVYYHYNNILARIGESSTGDVGVYNCYNRILGHANNVYDHVMDYTVIGAANSVSCTDYLDPFDYSISNGFIQGNNNTATNGSNIISMGNGNLSVGHNSVAIGSQLISKQWQTVIGKYNKEVNGPNRVVAPFSPNKTYVVNEFVYYDNNYYRCTVAVTTAGAWTGSTNWTVDYPDQESALFVVGNGYSETDGTEWQDETKIHRSNALEVYADGTVWARKFVSDEPTLSLSSGTGIDISETSANVVISLDADTANIVSVIKSRPQTGRYVLESNDGVLSWVNVGIV